MKVDKWKPPIWEDSRLLPCPFCGAAGLLEHLGGHDSTYRIVKCSKCRCDMHFHATEDLAIKVWNNRPKLKEATL